MKITDVLIPSPLYELHDPFIDRAGVRLLVKRDDLIHPVISGNKWRKLKYNILEVLNRGASAIISFGGAYSNHLYALATFGKKAGIKTIGLIRGEELNPESSTTLQHCFEEGMELGFLSRTEYRLKDEGTYFKKRMADDPNLFYVPEGGTNAFALTGVGEIVDECQQAGFHPDYYVTAAGTGGTAAGLWVKKQNVIAVAVLKNAGFLENDIKKWNSSTEASGQLDLQKDYHFGGYGKYTAELLQFIADFENRYNIPLEHVYTGKMFYGLFDLIKRGYFAKGTVLMAVHTGGLQGKLKP